MKELTLQDFIGNLPGTIRAEELVTALKGRPKSFPPILLLRRKGDEDNFQAVKVEEAIFNQANVEILLEDGEILSVQDDFRFQTWKE